MREREAVEYGIKKNKTVSAAKSLTTKIVKIIIFILSENGKMERTRRARSV